ncbi:hypothetical protein [Alteribacillus iranensis]|uniref:Uncharacterized protein n=1 Tax=Alteribacillus iranensis TaxID=930128 RepID=A0A1I2E656_9BACI|nr:hypothetical protein [Alteribacillus iranensis]SFE88432.1 hypothetical protein SAMN05192532_105134 [Alteribacillus iranensis]
MTEQQKEMLAEARSNNLELSSHMTEYWERFSGLDTWQFWIIVLMTIIPLIVLFFAIDRRKVLLIGFFGFNYHVWFAYVNSTGIRYGLWEYPYEVVPFLPSFALDASLVPITYMLVFQWTLNHNKNIFILSTITAAILAFIVKPIMVHLHYFHMFYGINFFHLFLFYIGMFLVSYGITKVFMWLQNHKKRNPQHP